VSINFSKTEVRKVMDVLDGDYETVGEAARACLALMEQIMQDRAKFVVVGQLRRSPEHFDIDPASPDAIKVSLGWYSTESEARVAAEQLVYNPNSQMEWRTWVLDVWHRTPSELHKSERDKLKLKQQARADKARAKLRAAIEKRNQEAQARAEAMRENAA
jgi:hypothetical protein